MARPQLQINRDRHGNQRVSWVDPGSGQVQDSIDIPVTRAGCAIEEHALSPSGEWIVTWRHSGQGEWGYDVIRADPLQRQAGIDERYGYMLDLPVFAPDESSLLGGHGDDWLGGWWSHPEDDPYDDPARGGDLVFGWLFVHRLPGHEVTFHQLRMTVPQGWFPADDPDDERWMGPSDIRPAGDGVHLVLPGGVPHQIPGPLAEVIRLPTPHPEGGRLL